MLDSATLFSLRLSLQVAGLATLLVLVSGIGMAYLLARKDFWGKELLDILLTLPLVLPPTVTGYYLIILFGRNGVLGRFIYEWTGWTIMFTWQAAVLASYVVSLPLMIKTARAALEAVDPNLINASYTLGHSECAHGLSGDPALGQKRHHRRDGSDLCPGPGGVWGHLDAGREHPRQNRHHAPGHLHPGGQWGMVSGQLHGHLSDPDFRAVPLCGQPFQPENDLMGLSVQI